MNGDRQVSRRKEKGKYVIITGATSGIGLAAAQQLADRGMNLGIVARNKSKANEVASSLRASCDNQITVDLFIGDMSSQRSIRRVAEEILEKCPKIDILINNAGAFFVDRILTEDELEKTWAVNHIAPFLLTKLLLDRLMMSKLASLQHRHSATRMSRKVSTSPI